MPEISIIIVGYNAEAFLKLTLFSVQKAIARLNAEVLFIDNSDNIDLVAMVRRQFPFVRVIDNHENLGFGRANNRALKQARGKLALLLNPDTIIAEDTLLKVIEYYKVNNTIGGLGIHMIDGTGSFLRESKRGLPNIYNSFCKFLGLGKFFPTSKLFTGYYQGHLPKDEIHHVDILAGAFLAMPRNASGYFELFNEAYFMYGEDVDLSYCLNRNVGKNIYLGTEKIIHFKGKSTESSNRIIYHFFHSMWLFYKIRLKKSYHFLVSPLLFIAIYSLCFVFILRSFLLRNLHTKNELDQPVNKVAVISGNKLFLDDLRQVDYFTDANLLFDDKKQGIQADLTIFDPNYISASEMIQYMNQYQGKTYFGFLCDDYSNLLISKSSFDKGLVFPIPRKSSTLVKTEAHNLTYAS